MSIFSKIFRRKTKAPPLSWEPTPSLIPAPYMLPKDGHEIKRLDMQHFILRQAFKANFLAPINQPVSILDVASGTSRWMKEVSEQYPHTKVH